VYQNGYGIVEKKLMGLQCRHRFQNLFYCGLKSGSLLMEVYRMVDEDVFFLYFPARNLFMSCTAAALEGINPADALSKRAKVVKELTEKNRMLEQSTANAKTNIPADIKTLLNDYYEKVNSMDFMDFMDDFDVQANILKAMLNTERM